MKRTIGFQNVNRILSSTKAVCLFVLLLICLFPSIVFSYDITLSWDASGDDAIDGYKVFMRIEGQAYDYDAPAFNGTATNYKAEALDYDVQYYFVARSYRDTDNVIIDSDDSNEIGYRRSAPASDEDSSATDPDPDSGSATDPDITDGVEGTDDEVTTGDGQTEDGSLLIKNMASYQPVLTSPEDGLTDVSLTPTLQTLTYTDSAQDNVHTMTEWQISRDLDFTSFVFTARSEFFLTELTVPQLMLEDNTTYFWRVRFFDNTNTDSEWSDAQEFTTGNGAVEDVDFNGVPDDLEIDGTVDLDQNGVPDVRQNNIKCMNTSLGNSQVGVGIASGDGTVDLIQSIDWDLVGDIGNRPKKMPMNLIGFRLLVETGAEVEVVIYFSEKLHKKAKWFKHDIQDGWQDFSEHTVFTAMEDGSTKVSFYLQDGGIGDEDGIANGVIVDPSGPGYTSLEDAATDLIGTTDNSGADASSGGGCFIGAGSFSQTASVPYLPSALLLLNSLVGLVWIKRK